MKKIVRDYPVDRLPPELRDGLPEHGVVEIELRLKSSPQARINLSDLAGSIPNIHGTEEEVIQHIRRLRGDE